MGDSALYFDFKKGRDTASPHMRTVASNASSMAARIRLSSIVSTAATLTIYAAFASLAAQAVALVASMGPLLGLLAAAPSLLFAVGAGVVPLIAGFAGLGAAMKKTAGGAGQSAQAIAAAERRIENAQRSATQAQEDLNTARQTAADRIADITRELARAHLDEEGAVLAVADAQRALAQARMSGDRLSRAHADLNYREAVQGLTEVRARLADVTEEEQRRREAGVEGSDEVMSATQRQADALYELADAMRSVSGGGGIDAAAEAYAKLTAEGRSLVDVLHAIGPSWKTVAQAMQSTVLTGVSDSLSRLSGAYLPVMLKQLPAIGVGWNNAFRGTADLASGAKFVADINSALANTATFWQRIGNSFAPFLSGFRHFTVIGATYLPAIGAWVQSIAERFERWALAARKAGQMNAWIENGAATFGMFWEIVKNLGASIVAIFRAGQGGPDWLPGLVAGTAALRGFLESPGGQEKLAAVFTTLREIGSQLWQVLSNLGPVLLEVFSAGGAASDATSVFSVVVGFLADNIHLLADALPVIIGLFIAYKAAQAGAVAVEAVRLPILAAQTVSSFALAAAMRANTAAILGNEAASKKGIVAMAAQKVAMIAGAVATGIMTAVTWLLAIAQMAAFWWIMLIIIAVAALVVGFIYLWNHSEGFRKFFIGMWEHIWSFLKMIGAWFAGPFAGFFVDAWNNLVAGFTIAKDFVINGFMFWLDTITHLPQRISEAAHGLWDGIVTSFKAAINWMLRIWNDFHLTLGGGTILGISIPSITLNTPDIPFLAGGGIVPATSGGRLAVLGEGGEDEAVIPLSRLGALGGGPVMVNISFAPTGDPIVDALVRELRKFIRVDSGGDVQVSLGR